MRLLLDTHIVIWAALDPNALSTGERKRMAEADMPLVLSALSVWELRLKQHSFHISGERKGQASPAAIVAFAERLGWHILPLTVHHASAALRQPIGHKDPFDELLLVQAQMDDMRLLTRDTKLIGHPFAMAGAKD